MEWREIAPGVVVMQYPLRAFGINFGRCVTLLPLDDGRLVIHSSAPFTAEDVAAIRRFGVPSWLVIRAAGQRDFSGSSISGPGRICKTQRSSDSAALPATTRLGRRN